VRTRVSVYVPCYGETSNAGTHTCVCELVHECSSGRMFAGSCGLRVFVCTRVSVDTCVHVYIGVSECVKESVGG
jgi:hypothetical protein